jgi:hypothetical protein
MVVRVEPLLREERLYIAAKAFVADILERTAKRLDDGAFHRRSEDRKSVPEVADVWVPRVVDGRRGGEIEGDIPPHGDLDG